MADLDYVKVVGRFGITVADGTGDGDDDPDTVWLDRGQVILTPLNTETKVPGGVPMPWTAVHAPITLTIDPSGHVTWNEKPFVMVVDATSPKVNPQVAPGKATHSVEFKNLKAGDLSVVLPARKVRLAADSCVDPTDPSVPMLPADGGVCDLTLLSPVLVGPVQAVVQGPRGVGVKGLDVSGNKLVYTLSDGTTGETSDLPAALVDSDAFVADRIETPASQTRTALDAAIEAGAEPVAQQVVDASASIRGFAAKTVRKMRRNADDVNVLVLSDSTMFYSGPEPRASRLLCEAIAAQYPGRPVKWRQWDDTAKAWEAAYTDIQTGSGQAIYWHNAAVVGSRMEYFLGSYFDTVVNTIQPDLVIINYGLNDGSTDTTGTKNLARTRALTIIESVRAAVPGAEVILSSQNERADVTNAVNALRASRYESAAADTGVGFIDVRQAFAEDPRGLTALLKADLLHPNADGSALIRDLFLPAFSYDPLIQPRATNPPSLLAFGKNLLTNGDFASFDSPPTLPNWTATNVTLSKDTSTYESVNGYSVDMVAASAAQSLITGTMPLTTIKGKWVTVAARIYIPADQTAGTVGRVAIACGDGGDRTSIAGQTAGRDGWMWVLLEKFIPTTATYGQVRIYGDTAANGSAHVKVDRVIAVLGRMPRGYSV